MINLLIKKNIDNRENTDYNKKDKVTNYKKSNIITS